MKQRKEFIDVEILPDSELEVVFHRHKDISMAASLLGNMNGKDSSATQSAVSANINSNGQAIAAVTAVLRQATKGKR